MKSRAEEKKEERRSAMVKPREENIYINGRRRDHAQKPKKRGEDGKEQKE
jgi:hypothetical protein